MAVGRGTDVGHIEDTLLQQSAKVSLAHAGDMEDNLV